VVPAQQTVEDPTGVLPGVVFWYGSHTRRWWALVLSAFGWRLLEALDADELARAVIEADTWPWPSPVFGSRL
jgi:hypothetical protein